MNGTENAPVVTFTVRWWITAGQDVRRAAFYRGATMTAIDTHVLHGPRRESGEL